MFILVYAMSWASTAQADLRTDFRSPEEAAIEIQAIAHRFQKAGDPRGLFAGIYGNTIRATSLGLQRGRFANPRWVSELVVNYANIYRRTLVLELDGKRRLLPRSWQLTFAYEENRRAWSADLDVVYGINVHIARDLVEALYVTPTDWRSSSVRRDFLMITQVLREIMPEIWKVYERYAFAIPIFSSLGQSVMMDWIARLRVAAWNDAYKTRDFSDTQKRRFLDQIDRTEWGRVQDLGLWIAIN